MRSRANSFILILFVFTIFSFTKKQDEKVNISGSVKLIHYWCSDEADKRTAEYVKPKPYSYKKLYIKEGETNDFTNPVITEVISDKDGNFSFALLPGKYIIVEERKKDKAVYDTILAKYGKGTKNCSPIDTACFRSWFQKPDAVLNVIHDSIKNITLTFHTTCPGACDIPCAKNTWYRPR